jgi:hypothetical protein
LFGSVLFFSTSFHNDYRTFGILETIFTDRNPIENAVWRKKERKKEENIKKKRKMQNEEE